MRVEEYGIRLCGPSQLKSQDKQQQMLHSEIECDCNIQGNCNEMGHDEVLRHQTSTIYILSVVTPDTQKGDMWRILTSVKQDLFHIRQTKYSLTERPALRQYF